MVEGAKPVRFERGFFKRLARGQETPSGLLKNRSLAWSRCRVELLVQPLHAAFALDVVRQQRARRPNELCLLGLVSIGRVAGGKKLGALLADKGLQRLDARAAR